MWGWIKLVWQGGCGLYTVYTCNSKNNLQSLGCGLYMVAAYTRGFTVIKIRSTKEILNVQIATVS